MADSVARVPPPLKLSIFAFVPMFVGFPPFLRSFARFPFVRLLLFRFVLPLHRFINDNFKKAGDFSPVFGPRKPRNPTAVDYQVEPTISCWNTAGEKCERQAVYALVIIDIIRSTTK